MKRLEFPGGVYGDALPTGEYAVLIKSIRFDTHIGEIPIPPEPPDEEGRPAWGPLYSRITNIPSLSFKIAGQASALKGITFEYLNNEWRALPITAFGVSPTIYDLQGDLHVATPIVGSQGYRYVSENGLLITGDATLNDKLSRLTNWTQYGTLQIGQGYTAGAIAIYNGVRRIIEPGDTQFIRLNRLGDELAITISKFKENKVVIYWLDISELNQFPIDEPIIIPPSIEDYPKHFNAGYFFAYSNRYGDNPSAPGNCTITGERDVIKRAPPPVILGRYEEENWKQTFKNAKPCWKKVIAIFASGSNADECAEEIKKAKKQLKELNLSRPPIIGYIDSPSFDRIPANCNWFGLQLYPSPEEDLESFRERAYWLLSRTGDKKLALICGAYDRNGTYTNIPELVRIQSLYPELVKNYISQIKTVLLFSDGRQGGTRSHEELRPWHTAMFNAIPEGE